MAARVGARDTAGGQGKTAIADFFQPPTIGTPDPDEMFGTNEGEVFKGFEGADTIFGERGGDQLLRRRGHAQEKACSGVSRFHRRDR